MVSIIDQLRHICLYRLHEGKVVKGWFRGRILSVRTEDLLSELSSLCSQFQFPSTAYRPYGLFILNRAGMHDYIHPIHREDEIRAAEGEHLMHRSYPEFTAKRLALAKSAPKSRLTWDPKRRAQHCL